MAKRPRGPNMGGKAKLKTIPAPIKGWNARDALADMAPGFAIKLENWFPKTDRVSLRNGYSTWISGGGVSAAVETLMVYGGGTTTKMFAAAGTAIYDASSTGTFGAASTSGKANARWQWTNFGTSGGQYLYAVNGADTPIYYDGAAWNTTTFTGTGLTLTNLIGVTAHKRRLFFTETGKLRFWYADVDSIGGVGALHSFELGSFFKRGGYLMAIGSWFLDGGAISDNMAVFITSNGEVAIYTGDDPSSSSSWAMRGLYYVGEPIGRRCILHYGGDLLILTKRGIVPLSKMFALSEGKETQVALSGLLDKEFSDAARLYSANYGWCMTTYAAGQMLIVNIPQTVNATQVQYVMNQISGAWCKFTGLNGNDWAVFNGALYFGGNAGAVYKADDGDNDNGSAIAGDCKPAFTDLGSAALKNFTMARPIITASGTLNYRMQFDVDFSDVTPTTAPLSQQTSGTLWDVGTWDVAAWDDIGQVYRNWTAIRGFGRFCSPRVGVNAKYMSIDLHAFDVLYETGAPVG